VESFLQLARYYNTDVPECNDAILEGEVKMWHQRYSNNKTSRIPSKIATDALSQCDNTLSGYFQPAKNIRDSTDNNKYQ
jgi:hypothetical protein